MSALQRGASSFVYYDKVKRENFRLHPCLARVLPGAGMRKLLLALAASALASTSVLAHEAPKSCAAHPDVNGPCFKVRGRLMGYNGSPGLRIWPIGTDRLLGVSDYGFVRDGYSNLPKHLAGRVDMVTHTVMFADFTVCPFTDDKPGVMRFVCVQDAKNISMRQLD